MVPTHVALVPYQEGLVQTDELLYVASALQTQATRDLGPVWDVAGVVSPFLRLEDVPPGYIAFAIVAGLPRPWHGFHLVTDGQPLALIGYQVGWPLLASHELTELLCDPWGNRRIRGRSLVDDHEEVEYLVEVCDPCQHETYTINGLRVTDFVTPDFYGPLYGTPGSYSFTGSVTHPLEIRPGGYITWRASNGDIWQKSGDAPPSLLSDAAFSRTSVDARALRGRPDVADALPRGSAARRPFHRLERTAAQYGQRLKRDIDQVLAQLGVAQPAPPVDAVRELLRGLSKPGSKLRRDFARDPQAELDRLGIPWRVTAAQRKQPLAPPEHYHGILAAFEGGSNLGDPNLAAWLSTQSTMHH